MVKCNNCKNLETKDNGFDSYSWCEKINDCPHEDIERDCEHYVPMINADRIRNMTENEAIEELKYDCNEIGKAIPCDTSWGESFENAYAMAIKALEEVQQYRQIGTVEECLRNKDFLDFLADKMNPNDFETYLSMYNSSGEKQEDERWED